MLDSAAALSRCLLSSIPNPSGNFHPKRRPPSSSFFFSPIRCCGGGGSSRTSPLSCSAIAQQSPTSPLSSSSDDPLPYDRLRRLVSEFRSLLEPVDRVKRLLCYAADLPPFPESDRIPSNRVMGCTAQVWLSAALEPSSQTMRFSADSDSEITKGFCACLISVVDGAAPEAVLRLRPDDFGDLNVVGVPGRTQSRVNTWHNVLISMQKRTKMLLAKEEGRVLLDPFPSLVIGADGVEAKGSYAEAQVHEGILLLDGPLSIAISLGTVLIRLYLCTVCLTFTSGMMVF